MAGERDDTFDGIPENYQVGLDGEPLAAEVAIVVPDVQELMQGIYDNEQLADASAEDPDEELFQDFQEQIIAAEEAGIFQGADAPVVERQQVYQAPEVIVGENLLAGPGVAAAAPQRAVWRSLNELPGYMGGGGRRGVNRDLAGETVRQLGRMIFRPFPCFQRMEADCRRAGRDPLGEVQFMADIAGRGPNSAQEMSAMADWIRANGTLVDGTRVEFPMIRGYRPIVLLAASEDDSFLMVEETIANGAPADAIYVYSWRGGRQFYQNNLGAEPPLQRIGGVMRPVEAGQRLPRLLQQAPAVGNPERPQNPLVGQQAPRAEQPVPPRQEAVAPRPVNDAPVVQPPVKGVTIKLPQPYVAPKGEADPAAKPTPEVPIEIKVDQRPAARMNAMQQFRHAGFGPVGTQDGPALQRILDDGRVVRIHGEGKSIALATNFRLSVLPSADASEPMEVTSVEGAPSALEWIESLGNPSLKI